MRRRCRLFIGALLLSLTTSLALTGASAVADTGGQATAFQEDPAHDGYQPSPGLTLPLQQNWTIGSLPHPSYPVVVNGVAYISTQPDPIVYAIDLSTGHILWHKWLGAEALAPAYDGGQLYVSNINGQIWALNPTDGTTVWTRSLDSSGKLAGDFESPPTAYGGQVYLSSEANDGATDALDETSGATVWFASSPGSTTPAVNATGVFPGSGCGQDISPSSGLAIWSTSTGCTNGSVTSALADGKLFSSGYSVLAGSNGYDFGTLPGDRVTPAVAGSVVYDLIVNGFNTDLQAIGDDGLGAVLWTFDGDGFLDTQPVVAGNVVYVGSLQGGLYAVDATTGSQLWSQTVSPFTAGWEPYFTGLAVADQALVVPAGNQLSVFSDSSPSVVDTTSALSSDPASPQYGQQVTVTDTIAGGDGGGTVDFETNGTSLSGCAAVPLTTGASGAIASCPIGAPPAGSETITAIYSGDAGYTSAVGDADVSVAKDPTTTSLAASSSTPAPRASVTLTATVEGSDGGGTVAFANYGSPINDCSSVALANVSGNEVATCTTTLLPDGTDQISASYSGDADYSGSAGSTSVTVELPPGSAYTWTGAETSYGNQFDGWSRPGNWSQSIGPSGSVGTLTFPDIGECTYGVCYASNDAWELAADGLVINSSTPYWLQGNSLSLGSGGLTIEGQASGGTGASEVGLPLVLTAPQSWTLDENEIPLDAVTGNQPLTMDFNAGSSAQPEADIEVGPITESGDGALYLDGQTLSGPTTVNSSDGNSLELENGAGIEADREDNTVGPLTVDSTGWVSVGGVADGGSSLAVDGALTFKSGSELDLEVDAPGTDASSDYTQLTATGNVNLGGATLSVSQGADEQGYCDNLNPGDTLTLVSTTGTITGSFANYASDSSVDIVNNCDDSTQDARGTINYSTHAVTLTITNGGNAGGIGGAGATGSDPPVEVSPPSLSGNAQWGETLSVDPGTWEQETSFEYSWWACDAHGNCEQIANADASSFQLTPAQVGDQIGAIVTAVGPGGTNYDHTNLSGVVAAEPVPVGTALPTASGTTTVGSTLTATSGSWTNAPTAYQYVWERCASYGAACNLISGATASTYLLTTADAGSTLRVEVTASNFGGKSAEAVSSATGVIRSASSAATPTVTTTPVITTAAVTTALHGVLKPTGKTASLSSVLAHRGYTFSFKAPASGRVTVTWTATVKHKTIIVAKGSARAPAAEATKVRVHLTSAGIAALRRHSRLRIRSKVTFKATNMPSLAVSSSFTLSGRHSARSLRNNVRTVIVRRIRRASGGGGGVMRNPSAIKASDFRH